MKKNKPVTDNEVMLKEGEFIVTKTDLSGKIIEVNREFIDTSGYSEEELLGQNHSIIRHPEMPAEIFKDLWTTIKADKPWAGMLKNRCKNGDYYWTHANITPVRENGKTVGYISLRTRPSDKEKLEAEELYKRINEGRSTLHSRGFSALVRKFHSVSVSYHMALFTSVVFVVLGLLEYAIYKGATLKEMHVGFAFAYIFLLVSCWGFYKYLKKPLDKAIASLQQLANGEMHDWIEIDRDDEFGRLLQNIKTVQICMSYDMYQAQLTSAINSRITEALYNVHSPVLITDTFSNIVYINGAMKEMLSEYKGEIDRESIGMDVDNLKGQRLDALYFNDELRDFLISSSFKDGQIYTSVGNFYLRVRSSRVVDATGKAQGVVMEWGDCYQENVIEKELENIIESALKGDLSQRINVASTDVFFSELSQSINQLIEVCGEVIDDTARVMGAVANGDLNHKIENDYEGSFGQLRIGVNKTVQKLTEIISAIHKSANSVSNGTHELAKGNYSLSERTKLQAQSVDETSAGMATMIETVRQNAENAVQANTLAADARKEAEEGVQVVSNAVLAMEAITESSNKIAAIIGVIDEIAFQTNLLALNAAVEAARAGEQGLGFAVVANEVRNLAGRSAVAAKEIKELIEDSVTKVGDGSKLVNDSGQRLSTITLSVKQVSEIVSEIAQASKNQSVGIEAASKSIEQIDAITKSNRELVQQATVSSTAISEQVNSLTDMVGFFGTHSGSEKTLNKSVDSTSSRIPGRMPDNDNHQEPLRKYG